MHETRRENRRVTELETVLPLRRIKRTFGQIELVLTHSLIGSGVGCPLHIKVERVVLTYGVLPTNIEVLTQIGLRDGSIKGAIGSQRLNSGGIERVVSLSEHRHSQLVVYEWTADVAL